MAAATPVSLKKKFSKSARVAASCAEKPRALTMAFTSALLKVSWHICRTMSGMFIEFGGSPKTR